MSLALHTIAVRHERRLRLVFTDALAAGAASASLYTVTSNDSLGTSPNVVAAILVANTTTAVDILLDADLTNGANYTVACASVPAVSGPAFTGSQALQFALAAPTLPNVEPEADDSDAVVFGVDLVWDGGDYVETASGDLETVSGIANARGAVLRRITGDPLPWDPSYSANAYDFVDSPIGNAPTLRGAILAQARADDRVTAVTCDVTTDDAGNAVFDTKIWLLGQADPVTASSTVQTS